MAAYHVPEVSKSGMPRIGKFCGYFGEDSSGRLDKALVRTIRKPRRFSRCLQLNEPGLSLQGSCEEDGFARQSAGYDAAHDWAGD